MEGVRGGISVCFGRGKGESINSILILFKK